MRSIKLLIIKVKKNRIGWVKIKSSEVEEDQVQRSKMGKVEVEKIEIENWKMENRNDIEEIDHYEDYN